MNRLVLAAWMLVALATACAKPIAPPVGHELAKVGAEDTLLDLARTYGLGYREIVAANPGVDPWVPPVDETVVLPTTHLPPDAPRDGIVVNLATQRLWWFGPEEAAQSYPIGIGRPGWRTPIGATRVRRKKEGPTWHPTASARREDPSLPRAIGPGPDNPLGTHAIYLGWPRYLIHGTDEPYGVGRRVSRGCIRLYPEDIPDLYARTELGLPVRVVNEPVKIGWIGDDLYLDVHPPLSQSSEAPLPAPTLEPLLEQRILDTAGDAVAHVDWDAVDAALAAQTGIPTRVTGSGSVSAGR
ncbi:MAG: L,D-transpeptidase family protein [Myxococcales bacterium]|nr:L,D-transpeptidase family protein [Myxococcales bacterium]